MKIGLCDIDSHNWPNLCLMKLSAYHKARGDSVEWWRPEGRYDRPSAPAITRQLQRWVNNKRIFYTVPSFADYIPGRMGGGNHA